MNKISITVVDGNTPLSVVDKQIDEKLKGIKIIQSIFSDYNRIKLKMTTKNISGKEFSKTWKLNNISLNNTQAKKKKRNQKIF